jgi:hypothetical protein
MADKKDSGGEDGGGLGLLWLIIIIVLLLVVFFGFTGLFNPTYINIEYFFGKLFDGGQGVFSFFTDNHVWSWFKIIMSAVSVLLIGLNIYLIMRLLEMEKEHADHVYHHTDHEEHEGGHDHQNPSANIISNVISSFDTGVAKEKPGLPKWEIVLDYISSKNESDWRLAIIEADNILDEVIENQGYPGVNLGERLKNAGEGAFQTYQDAWEAHRMRNRIAHEGSDFTIVYRDARRAISQYENVFREFGYI